MTLQERFDKWLVENDRIEKAKRKSGVISPSSLGQCYRRQYWTRKGETPSNPTPVETLRVFQAGKLFHDLLQRHYSTNEVEVLVQSPNWDVYGHADIVTDDEVIDIKSQNSFAFKAMAKPGFDISTEKPDYCLQLMCYASLLHKPQGRLVFVNKESLEIREFVLITKDWERRLYTELDRLRDIWQAQETPSAEPRLYKGKEGNYCQFSDKCWAIEGKKCVECKSSGQTFVF